MTRYAEAECATCHAIRPKNEMRQETVRVESGQTHYASSGNRSSSGQSMSFGGGRPARLRMGTGTSRRSHGGTRTHYRNETVWVCHGCKAPKSADTPGMAKLKTGLVVGALFAALAFFSSQKETPAREFSAGVPSDDSMAEVQPVWPSATPTSAAVAVADEASLPEMRLGTTTDVRSSETDLPLAAQEAGFGTEADDTWAMDYHRDADLKPSRPATTVTAASAEDALPPNCRAISEDGLANEAYLREMGCEMLIRR
ncbi:hypothetical protein [Aurantiacibacter luteus]|uniref:hypothetical protein n=1 Tax=Aurantiacibacter luteus TaxID=1581420 RepID=UPI000ACAD89C|nr:hypothetical protein [Aurantiacibacter luteus]